jgi:MFS family permease
MLASAAYKTRSFWVLFKVFLIVATCLHGAQIHLPSLLSDRGLPTEMAVAAFSLLFAVTAVTRVGAGFLFDRMFAPIVGGVLFILGGIGIALVVPHYATIYYLLGAILIGIGTGAETDLLGYLTSRYYGIRAFGQIYGGLFLAFMIGSAIGPYALGWGFDTTGSYDIPLFICVGGMVVACLLLLTLPRFPKLDSNDAAPAPAQSSS